MPIKAMTRWSLSKSCKISGRSTCDPEQFGTPFGGNREIAAQVVYAILKQRRKLIEQSFGWAEAIGQAPQAMVRRLEKVGQILVPNVAYKLVRARALVRMYLQTGKPARRPMNSGGAPIRQHHESVRLNASPSNVSCSKQETALAVDGIFQRSVKWNQLLGTPLGEGSAARSSVLCTGHPFPKLRQGHITSGTIPPKGDQGGDPWNRLSGLGQFSRVFR